MNRNIWIRACGSFPVLLALGLTAAGCKQEQWPGPRPETAKPANAVETFAASVRTPTEGPSPLRPHILLTRERLATLDALARMSHPAWEAVRDACKQAGLRKIDSGYEAWDWAHAALSCAMAYRIMHDPAYARTALLYLTAMLDDKTKVGDGKGGDAIVRHDDGYPIRTHGLFGAIAYDWLYDAPGMTSELQKHAVDRFVSWTDWFKAAGYKRDQPISNYYMGYFGAVAFGGLAAGTEDPRGAALRAQAHEMFTKDLVPALRKIEGGDWPEGWQYGPLVAAVVAFYADAEGGHTLDDLPWLRGVVSMRTHALWPDGKHVFDNGDWEVKPPVAGANELLPLAAVLPASEPQSKAAFFLATLAKNKHDDWPWLRALGTDPNADGKSADPRQGPTSYLARGTGTLFARTDWTPGAVWFALTSSPYMSDHQHADAGSFEIVRGGDPLIVNPSGYGSYATMGTNSILVDDHRENMPYAPNQGAWGNDASVTRFEDSGDLVYGEASFTSAYNPNGYPGDRPARSVTLAEREALFVRGHAGGARVILYDRVSLTKPTYGAIWVMHGATPPEVTGAVAHVASGQSAAWVTTLLPSGVVPKVLHEPTLKSDGAFTKNDPADGLTSTRMEVASPRGTLHERFLHSIAIGAAGDTPAPATLLEGDDADGVSAGTDAYVFGRASQATPAKMAYKAPLTATRHVVVGLAPNGHYSVDARSDGAFCRVSLSPNGPLAASSAGLLVVTTEVCKR